MTSKTNLSNIKNKISIEQIAPKNTQEINDIYSSTHQPSLFSISNFLKNFQIKINSIDFKNNSMEFDMINIDTSIANAFRRILLSEIPTMAINEVTILQNTSILQDEVLVHRLGLIPIKIDPRKFPFVNNGYYDPSNTLVFNLKIECKENKECKDNQTKDDKYINHVVYSKSIKFIPQPGQESFNLTEKEISSMIDKDIIIAKLRPGQKIECWMKVNKGYGKQHAKWSPVGTAYYKLLPEIIIKDKKNNFKDEKIKKKLVNLCPMNVFDIEDNEIIVKNNRNCSICRVCISDEKGFGNKIKINKIRNHFIFSIESIGHYNVVDLFKEALKILIGKCESLLKNIEKMKHKSEETKDDIGDDDMHDID